jgi:hypothetical protein
MLVLAIFVSMLPVGKASAGGKNLLFQPHDMERVEFSLLTVGLGPEVYMRYGHTMIRMHDLVRNQEYDFNWGIFDFSDPMFAFNFFRGIQIYRLGVSGSLATIRTYRDYEHRKVWKEKINLTNAQKQTLVNRIFWNLEPENVTYPYQHFYNNCSTKPRDYLDEVFKGKIKGHYEGQPASQKFRDYLVKNLNSPVVASFGLDIVMNSKLDGPMNAWEEMFYPEKLRELLLKMDAFDDDGNVRDGVKVLSGTELLVDAPDYPSSPWNANHLFLLMFGVPLVGTVTMLFNSRSGIGVGRKKYVRLFGAILMFWGFLAGALGSVMLLAWVFSRHLDTLHNVNLWILWPVDFIYVIAGWKLLRSGSALKSGYWSKVVRRLSMGHLLAMIPYGVMAITGFFAQNISNMLIYILPLAAILYSAVVRLSLFNSTEDVRNV